MACDTCRERKVKCDKAKPKCSYCKARELDCRQKPSRGSSCGVQDAGYREPLQRLEHIWSSQPPSQNLLADIQALPTQTTFQFHNDINIDLSTQVSADDFHFSPNAANLIRYPDWTISGKCPGDQHSTSYFRPIGLSAENVEDLLGEILGEPRKHNFQDAGPSTTHGEENSMYIGPSSGLLSLLIDLPSYWSKCASGTMAFDSKPLLDLCQSSFTKILHGLEKLSELSVENMPLPSNSVYPLPSAERMTTYIDVYFNTSQVIFPIIRRNAFEAASKNHQDYPIVFDVSWYMLQNAVLAVGAFTTNSVSSPDSYKCAKEEASGYFNNALNMQPFLLRRRTSIMAVQACCVMSMFAQMIGNPNLAYFCSSFATQLAQIKGLHKKSREDNSKNLLLCDDRERTFWILYFFDKVLGLETGHPSNIDDADISCPFPAQNVGHANEFSADSIEVLLHFVRFAQICSRIKRRLYSATALNRDPRELSAVRDALCHDLAIWREKIPAIYHAKRTPFRVSSLPPGVKPVRAILLRIACAYARCSIHRRFSSSFASHLRTPKGILESQQSDKEHLQAARELILLLGQLEMDVDTPSWFFAYHLLTGVVPLFIHVITNPLHKSAKEDISLMSVAAGMCGRLEFISCGEFVFAGVGEFSQLATIIARKARGEGVASSSMQMNEDLEAMDTYGSDLTLGDPSVGKSFSVPEAFGEYCYEPTR